MNKNAIKKFAIEARKKLIDSVTDKAGMLGITEKSCSEPITKGSDFEVYQTVAGTEVTLNKRQCEQRRRLVSQIESRGFEAVVEEVAYTWFNRICAIRFMEVNDYLPNRVRVLSSEKAGQMEPDLVTQAPDVDLDLTAQEKEEIISWKLSGTSEDTDKLYCKLFLKQCHQLHDILPGLFEADSDYMELLFGISYTNKDDVIYMLVNPETGIPENDFNVSTLDEEGNSTGQVEIIGWLYQYYNTELKDDTFAKLKKNVKITKERIPAATQLFTPDWIVRYMVENSVGRIWIEHLRAVDPSTDEKATAERFGWKYYLPEAEQEEDVNVKLAEIRTTYKDLKPTDITCIDPCMGSGHILIAMFDVLMDIYESAGYDKREAAFEIVEHNIHGLDIDQRAYQLAYFAVMMKGRGYNRRFLCGRDGKPEPKVYAIAESNEINRNHLQFFGTHLSEMERNLAVTQIEGLLDTFKDAREYGAILHVDACDWDVLERFVDDLGTNGQISFESVGSEETQKVLRKLVRMAKNLGQKYAAVVTNPPYMGSSGMGAKLSKYVKDNYPDTKTDLSTVFMEKCVSLCNNQGYMSMINIPVWMNLASCIEFRKEIIIHDTLINMLHFGRGVFGSDFGSTAFVIKKCRINRYMGLYRRLFLKQGAVDSVEQKEKWFFEGIGKFCVMQEKYLLIPGYAFTYQVNKKVYKHFSDDKKVGDYAVAKQGLITGSNDTFMRTWFEIDRNNMTTDCMDRESSLHNDIKWYPYNKGGEYRKWYGNCLYVVDWSRDGYGIQHFYDKNGKLRSRPQNMSYYFREGLTWTALTAGKFSMRYSPRGFLFDAMGPVCFANNKNDEKYILGLLNSKVGNMFLRIMCPNLKFDQKPLENVPLLKKNEKEINDIVNECIQIAKKDWDSYETSWDFEKCALIKTNKHRISEAMEEWNGIICERRSRMKQLEYNLNTIFNDIYELQDTLPADIQNEDVTLSNVDIKRDVKQFISYAVGCMFGRYSLDLDKEGLICGGGLIDYDNYQTFPIDKDNIIPITDEEYFEDDIVNLFIEFVKKVYGETYLEENLDYIAKALESNKSPREAIRQYFLNDFYKDHCVMYSGNVGKRPIYWLFDSGKQNGFKALIYMHRYDADTVGRVRTDYLHRAQKYVETAMQSAQYTIDNASSASEKSKATKAVTKYTKQLAEMKIYDEAIAHIANKRIEIDLDDGVKVNYEKFQGVEVAQEGKKALKVDLLATIK